MTEEQFKRQFIANFLSTWCAINHTDYCMRGLQKELEQPPVEDAIFLANAAWKAYLEIAQWTKQAN